MKDIFKNKNSSEYDGLVQELRLKDCEFHYRYLRMSKERFEHLYSLVEAKIKKKDTNFRKAIPARQRLVIALRYLATGCSQQTLSYSFRVGRTTISNILTEVCSAIYEALSNIYLKPPSSAEEWKRISNDFDMLWNMPHVIGAIDGKHIAMDCPKGTGSQYYNYKGFFSLVLLAVCDARYSFTMVDVGQYGSNNDSGVMLNSEMGQRFDEDSLSIPPAEKLPGCDVELSYYLVGDEIFPLKTWLMRPYPGKLSEEQRIYNYRLSRARRVVENAFGILVARWRLFRSPIRATKENVMRYVLAAVCLHIYLRQTENAMYCPTGFIDSEDSSGRLQPGEWRRLVASDSGCLQGISRARGSRYAKTASAMREQIKTYVNSETGSVPWQLNYIRSTGEKD